MFPRYPAKADVLTLMSWCAITIFEFESRFSALEEEDSSLLVVVVLYAFGNSLATNAELCSCFLLTVN